MSKPPTLVSARSAPTKPTPTGIDLRADQLLVLRGQAVSRAQAQRLIASGLRWRVGQSTWRAVGKNGDEIPPDAELELQDASEAQYVSRGGLKLSGALRQTGIAVAGKVCLDVGQSTGGFTDCLLQLGASRVVGVDVGLAQLHPRLRADPRVLAIEHVNARELNIETLQLHYQRHEDLQLESDATGLTEASLADDALLGRPLCFDLIVGDLSFISQTLVLPAIVPLLKPGGDLLMLVKPQFELQPGQVGKGGIVKDDAMYPLIEKRIRQCCKELGLQAQAWMDSPIAGGDGNREFFMHSTLKP